MDDLKVHIDKLEDILQEVKKQNNTKDEEIRALRNKMLKMEQVIPLISNESQEKNARSAPMRARSSSEGKALEEKPNGEQSNEQVSTMMDDDSSFRRGHMRWMRQEQVRLKNLQQQEISKQLRRQNGPHRFIPPEDRKLRFPFKSNPKHRNSWTPGTHIIITDEQVIELKVPKEAVQEEEDGKVEATEPREQVVPIIHTYPPLPSPMGQRRSKDLEQGLSHRHNQSHKLHERGRSNSFNSSQHASDSTEPLNSGTGSPLTPNRPITSHATTKTSIIIHNNSIHSSVITILMPATPTSSTHLISSRATTTIFTRHPVCVGKCLLPIWRAVEKPQCDIGSRA